MGKTTVAATLGLAASRLGLDTLLVEIEGKRGLASLFDEPGLVYADTELVDPAVKEGQAAGGRLRARTIRANDALVDYFEDHGLRRFGKALTKMQVLDTLATSTPGLKDLIVLGKIKQLEMAGAADLIIVDAPASGHAISFLRSAKGLQATIEGWAATDAPRPIAFGLDVTERAKMTPDHLRRLGQAADDGSHPMVDFVEDALRFYFEFHRQYDGFYGAFIHDALVVAASLDPSLARTEPQTVEVELDGRWTTGETVTDWRRHWGREPNLDIAVTADDGLFFERFVERVGRLARDRRTVG